jgi:hypothetical protein
MKRERMKAQQRLMTRLGQAIAAQSGSADGGGGQADANAQETVQAT